MKKIINHKLLFSQSPEMVWEYLTRPELMELWLMKNDFQPIVGHQFQFRTSPMPQLDFDGIMNCTVLEIIPFKKLSYSWQTGPGNGEITLDSVVTWTLHQKGNSTELELVHTGFAGMEHINMFAALDGGWLSNIQKIAHLLNTATNGAVNA